MTARFFDNRKHLYWIMAAVLLAGLCCAAVVYFNTESPDTEAYEFKAEDSRMFRHNLEVYGGKISLALSDFSVWFSELWQGRQLAYTIVFITVSLCLLIFLAAHYLVMDIGVKEHDSRGSE
ncbi:MAG: hypothetical protein RBT37_00945 [Dissulfurispiraceae bacterium]|jgi:hypothetical protein|nr:hypothetical protein [Dissulfurispiraceae bacterium]